MSLSSGPLAGKRGLYLRPHGLKIVLLQPRIAPNTGNIARLCVTTGTELHLVRPLGFVLDDRMLRRSAMDYWPRLRLQLHDDSAALFSTINDQPKWLFSSEGNRSYWDANFRADNWLIFGNETDGIETSLLSRHHGQVLRIPQLPDERCLNLSTAAGIVLYEALRQCAPTDESP